MSSHEQITCDEDVLATDTAMIPASDCNQDLMDKIIPQSGINENMFCDEDVIATDTAIIPASDSNQDLVDNGIHQSVINEDMSSHEQIPCDDDAIATDTAMILASDCNQDLMDNIIPQSGINEDMACDEDVIATYTAIIPASDSNQDLVDNGIHQSVINEDMSLHEQITCDADVNATDTAMIPVSDSNHDLVDSGIHQSVIDKESRFSCAHCDRFFRNAGALAMHTRSHKAAAEPYTKPKRTCPYCGVQYCKLKRHVLKAHSDQAEVQSISENSSVIPKDVVTKIRNRGILMTTQGDTSQSERVHCRSCKGSYSPAYFYRHKQLCALATAGPSQGAKPVRVSLLDESDHDFADILQSFHKDEAGDLCRTDPTIRLIGKRLWAKDKSKVDKRQEVRKSVMASMRSLATLYVIFRQHYQNANGAADMFQRQNWNHLREAVCDLSISDKPDAAAPIKPGLKNNTYYLLSGSATTLQGEMLSQVGDEDKASELGNFIKLLKHHQDAVFGDAKYHINKARQERLRLPERTPPEQAMADLREYTLNQINSLTKIYKENLDAFEKTDFVALRNAICSRITLFNARRGGEPSRLTVSHWMDRKKWVSQSAINNLDEVERQLFKELDVVYSTGKGNHVISSLVPADCKEGMYILCTEHLRSMAGINIANKYLFPNTQGSSLHVGGWDATNNMCLKAKVACPQLNATTQRCRISTLYAGLDIPTDERQYFYSHMGHSAQVNAGSYQRPLPVLAVTKVGAHLKEFDAGKSHTSAHKEITMCSNDGSNIETDVSEDQSHILRQSLTPSHSPPPSEDESDVSDEVINTPVKDTGRMHWTGEQTSLIKKVFKKWIDLPSPNKSLPGKTMVLQFLKENSHIRAAYTKVRTKIMNEQKKKQQSARKRHT